MFWTLDTAPAGIFCWQFEYCCVQVARIIFFLRTHKTNIAISFLKGKSEGLFGGKGRGHLLQSLFSHATLKRPILCISDGVCTADKTGRVT